MRERRGVVRGQDGRGDARGTGEEDGHDAWLSAKEYKMIHKFVGSHLDRMVSQRRAYEEVNRKRERERQVG